MLRCLLWPSAQGIIRIRLNNFERNNIIVIIIVVKMATGWKAHKLTGGRGNQGNLMANLTKRLRNEGGTTSSVYRSKMNEMNDKKE